MKILFSAIVFMILLVGCDSNPKNPTEPKETPNILHTEKYDGHLWVVYRENCGNAGMGGLAHHPDCPCLKNNNEKAKKD